MKKQYIIIMTAIALTACQKVVDADRLLDAEEKVYISGYISPSDTLLRIHVSKALPAIGTPLPVSGDSYEATKDLFLIKDAMVNLSDAEGNSVSLGYSEELASYTTDAANLPIFVGRQYFLNVNVAGRNFNASCQIPKKVETLNETITFRDDEFVREAEINLGFQDIPDERNYYVLGGMVATTFQYENEEPQSGTFALYFDTDQLLSDNLNDGGNLNGTTSIYMANNTEVLENTVTLQVANVEEILFQQLQASYSNADNEGNPFVEYSIAPNNIEEEGGIGVFAGYSLTEKVIEVNQ